MKRIGLLLVVLFAIACGGGGGGGGLPGGGGNGGNFGVNLNLNNANLSFNQTLNLTATVPGVSSQTVTWSATGGIIDPTGPSSATYTAPAAAGNFTITARSAADNTKFATVIVKVSQVGVTIDPTATTLGPGKSTTFTVTVTGSTSTTANLTATGGTVTRLSANTFTYTAPTALGNYTLTGSAASDSTKTAKAVVTVASLGSNAVVTGSVRLDGTVTGVNGITVAFYSATGVELGRTTTGVDGRFTVSIPATAKKFHVIASSLSPNYFGQYTYGALRYSATILDCVAPLPALTVGGTTALPASIFITQSGSQPPPPPNGCTGF